MEGIEMVMDKREIDIQQHERKKYEYQYSEFLVFYSRVVIVKNLQQQNNYSVDECQVEILNTQNGVSQYGPTIKHERNEYEQADTPKLNNICYDSNG
ncbi:MAG: hypothetical protein J6Y97_07665 [Prevotella sp.]|nr:hypothetical protein [Prevotella sp.]